tara:strand:+ start:228 stop:1004 length:777 start_codon:yes stop_codon:yes gene_type:complete
MSKDKFKNIIYITKNDFFSNTKIFKIRKLVISGNIVILKSAFNKKKLRDIFKNILKNSSSISKNTKMIEGVKNIFYKSNSTGKGKYTTNDCSWYFFPWNDDKFGLTKFVQKFFDRVILLNKYSIDKIRNNTPIDGIIQRFHLMYYPLKRGHISSHKDPTNITKITCGIYITSYKEDYDRGGFYVYNSKKEKIFIDHKIESGDLILFYNGLIHGVDPIFLKKNSKKNKDKINGRVFLNLSILESHEKPDRKTTVGIKIN